MPKALLSGIWFLQQQLRALIYPWNNADIYIVLQSRQLEQ
jgi:hypothetical protein